MPQLDFNTYAGQLFWLAVIFASLYLLMWKLVLPSIGGVIETRGSQIQGDLSVAETAKNQAEVFQKQHQKLLLESGEQARKLMDDSTNAAKLVAEKRRGELLAQLDAKMAETERELQQQEDELAIKTKKVVQELGKQIATKIMAA